MKQKTPRTTAKPSRHTASPQPGAQRAAEINNWGFRWHAGRFRVALWMTVLAFAIVLTFGQQSGRVEEFAVGGSKLSTRNMLSDFRSGLWDLSQAPACLPTHFWTKHCANCRSQPSRPPITSH